MDPSENEESLHSDDESEEADTGSDGSSIGYGDVDISLLFPEEEEPHPLVAEAEDLTQLIAMFPNIDEDYIRQIHLDPPVSGSEDDDVFVLLINHLLACEEQVDKSLVVDDNENQEVVVVDEDHQLSEQLELEELAAVQEQLSEEARNDELLNELLEHEERERLSEAARNDLLLDHLLGEEQHEVNRKLEIMESILPDADPDELKKVIEEHEDDPEFLEEFVNSKLVDRNYGKRAEYYAKLNRRKMIEQYTSKFDVGAFVKQFPEPIEHFENPNRQCSFQELGFKYLKDKFDLNDQYLREQYSDFSYNLSLTVNYFRSLNFEPSVGFDQEIEDIPLLQEIAFIENKTKIQQYLETVQEKEEQELRILRAKKILLQCECCSDDLKPYDSIECKNGHLFCKTCIFRGTNAAISDGKTNLHCFMGCGSEIDLSILRKVLPVNTFETFFKKRQEDEVMTAQINDLECCPYCTFVMILDPQIEIFMCKNPECKKITCRNCKKLYHLPTKCEDVLDEHKGRLFVEEEMTEARISRCYKCKKAFVKKGGCNLMECKFCRAKWCHICKIPVKGHCHFSSSTNCRYIDSEQFDEEQVQLKRYQASQKVNQDNPDFKFEL